MKKILLTSVVLINLTNMTEPKTENRGAADLEYRIDYLTNQNKFLKDKLVKAAEDLKKYKEVLRKEGEPSFIDQLRKEGKL